MKMRVDSLGEGILGRDVNGRDFEIAVGAD